MKFILVCFWCFHIIISFAQPVPRNETAAEKPFILGRVIELESKHLAEKRVINVYLPEGYNDEDTTRYPVVYLLDGSADEDFIHIVGLYQFYSFPWVNKVSKSIVVGIANVDRRIDFTFPTKIKADKERYATSGHSNRFIAFIGHELQPYISGKFRTTASRTIIGQSLGGLVATEILLKKTALFDRYIIISPSLWWDNGSLLNFDVTTGSEFTKNKTSVYIGVGKEGLTPTLIPRVMEVDANLLADKLSGLKSDKLKIHFDYLPGEDHGTIMHQGVANALKVLGQTN